MTGRNIVNELLRRLLPKSFQRGTGESLRMMEKNVKSDWGVIRAVSCLYMW